jgi:hypothetical protein
LILLTPLIDFLIEILGWILVVLGLIGLVLAVLSWMFGSRNREL